MSHSWTEATTRQTRNMESRSPGCRSGEAAPCSEWIRVCRTQTTRAGSRAGRTARQPSSAIIRAWRWGRTASLIPSGRTCAEWFRSGTSPGPTRTYLRRRCPRAVQLRCQDRATDLPRPPSSPTTELSNGIEPSVGVNPHSERLTPTGQAERWSKFPSWKFTATGILKLLLNNGASRAVHVTADANARLGPYLLGRGSRDGGINRRFEGGTTMEQVATVPLVHQNANASSTPEQAAETPEQAAERIRALLLDDESDPWELGDLLNTIAKRDLARKAGYRSTRAWLFAKVPEAEAKDAALYRCAHVASLFSKEQAKFWGVIKLDALATHDYDTRRPPD